MLSSFCRLKNRPTNLGFTLAELLIALAILGVIAIFTIPKILQAQQDQRKKVIFRETFAAISQIYEEGLLSGDLNHGNVATYLGTKMNAVKICADAYADGCNTFNSSSNGPAYTLHNGATIYVWNGGGMEDFWIDWNGDQGPNTEGDDTLWLIGNSGASANFCNLKPGQVGMPDITCSGIWTGYTVNANLYNSVFSN